MPHHHVQHAQNVWPILFARNENIAHIMPHVTVCAVMSCMHRAACACRQAGHPNYTWQFTYGHAVRASQMIFIKINHLTF